MAEVFRLILEYSPGRVDTGATYGGCSQANAGACDPQQFANVQDAVNYAKSRGETPIRVTSEDEAWLVANGQKPITDSMVIRGDGSFSLSSLTSDPMMLGVVALGAIFLLPKLLGRR
jgi:hypothetical protein